MDYIPAMHLRATIESLASDFAAGVLAALRTVSLEEVIAESGKTAPRGPRGGIAPAVKRKPGGPVNRAPSDVDETISGILSTLRAAKEGLRAEQIRSVLGIDKPTVTKALTKALASKSVTKTGEKRATTYFAK